MITALRTLGLGTLIASLLLSSAAVAAKPAKAQPLVLMISIDGLKPEAVFDAQSHGLKVPNLKALVADGAYATSVTGVLPTITYPSHMTMLTGASPANHGIIANTTFDPYNRNAQGWYWYAEDVKAQTLWDAAHAAHLTTANIYWPTSVGATITYNLPQMWRTGTNDDHKLQRALNTLGLEQELSKTAGTFPGGMEETVAEDEIRSRFAIAMMKAKHPQFFTVYLTGLDTEQHKSGPFSADSNAVLERLDVLVGNLRAAAEAQAPGRATICVVSDHGFAKVDHDVNLYGAFLKAGLFSIDESHKINGWKAMPWPAGGSAAIMLSDPADQSVKQQVQALLTQLASDPANGIERILTHDELVSRGGFPDAAFFVAFRLGYELGYEFTDPLVSKPSNLGMHGYLSDFPEMRSSFFMVGPKIAAHQSVGDIDMRRIAPTVAAALHLKLANAEQEPLTLKTR